MNPNPERDERLRQLEAAVFPDTGRRVPSVGEQFTVTEITPDVLDFHDGPCTVVTLSLLDSQAAGSHEQTTLSVALKTEAESAATRMRDRCLEKVRRKADSYQKDSERSDYLPNYRKKMALAASVLREVANDLQSLTLEVEV